MIEFFAEEFHGAAFEYFGMTHLAMLGFLVLLNVVLLMFRNARDTTKARVRWLLAFILLTNEIVWHLWNYIYGKWDIQTMLPLHLCSLLVWTGAFMLLTKNYRVYEFMYFMGIGGAIQALATPGIGDYNFPHFLFFQYFMSHGLIITSAIYMTVVEDFRPTWRSMLRVAVWMNVYVVIVYFINRGIGSNYLMINYKPETPSLLDLLPDWPVYILYMELVGVITMLLLYLPFALGDLRNRYLTNRESTSRLDSISK